MFLSLLPLSLYDSVSLSHAHVVELACVQCLCGSVIGLEEFTGKGRDASLAEPVVAIKTADGVEEAVQHCERGACACAVHV